MSTRIAQPFLTASLTQTRSAVRDVESKVPTNDVSRLTRRLADGDEAAFREFHAEYFDRLYRFLLVVARGQEQEAQEALQDTLLRVARRGREFRSEEAFWCWLKVVARNAARDGGRKRLRYAALLRNFALRWIETGSQSTTSEEDRLSALLSECLDGLSVEDRQLVEGKYLEGATTRELSELTSLTEKAVESRLARLRCRLRTQLLNKLNEP